MGNEKIFLHPRLVDTTLVVVVMVAEDVLTTSDFSVVCVLVKANTFLGARSNGDNVKSAPDNGHFSWVTTPFSTSSSVSLSLELPSNEHCSEKLTEEDGVITVGDVVNCPIVVLDAVLVVVSQYGNHRLSIPILREQREHPEEEISTCRLWILEQRVRDCPSF